MNFCPSTLFGAAISGKGERVAAAIAACALVLAVSAQAKETETIPNFSAADLSWVKVGDDFIAPARPDTIEMNKKTFV